MIALTWIGASYGLIITMVLVIGRAAAADPVVIVAPPAPERNVTNQFAAAEFRPAATSSQILGERRRGKAKSVLADDA